MTRDTLDRSSPPGPGPIRPFEFPAITRVSRADAPGLVAATIPETEIVTACLVADSGAGGESSELAGVSSLAADLLDTGTGLRTGYEIAEAMESLGAEFTAVAGWDAMQVVVTALRDRIGVALQIVGEMVRDPAVPAEELDRIRNERLAEIAQRRADPRGLANEAARRFLYGSGIRPLISLDGTIGSVGAIGRDHVTQRMAETVGRPRFLVVAGAMDGEEAERLAHDVLGSLPSSEGTSPVPAVRSSERTTEIVLVDRPDAAQTELRIGHLGVTRHTPDYFPIAVMNTVLGGYFSSRLNRNLRERRGFTYGCSSRFGMHRFPGTFVVSTAVQTESAADAVSEVLAELNGVRAEPVTAAELEDAKRYRAGVYPLSFQRTEGVVAHLAEVALYGLPQDYIDRYAERILGVDADQVLDAARTYIHPEALVVVVVGPAREVQGPLESLGIGPVRVVEPLEVLESAVPAGT